MIVVGVDGSQPSKEALHWAMRHASILGTPVRAIAVWHHPKQFGWPRVFADEGFEREARGWLEQAVTDIAREVPDCDIEQVIERGYPPRVLLDASDREEMLVLGHRGRGAIADMMVGSVVLKAIQQANCPVMVIR